MRKRLLSPFSTNIQSRQRRATLRRIVLYVGRPTTPLKTIRDLSFSPVGKDKQRYIWIDAICIDQSSAQERASQVKLMGSLYSHAESIIA